MRLKYCKVAMVLLAAIAHVSGKIVEKLHTWPSVRTNTGIA